MPDDVPDDAPADAAGLPDMGGLLDMAMEMQQQLLAAQDQAQHTVVEGQAGGGVVRIAVTGGFEFRSVTIDPEAVDPDDVDMLQDLVLAALHDAVARVNELVQAANPMVGFDLGSLDLGGLGGLGGIGDLFGGLGGGAELGALDVDEVDEDEDEDDDDEDVE